jgi:hypothetical protein
MEIVEMLPAGLKLAALHRSDPNPGGDDYALRRGPDRSAIDSTLHDNLGAILGWIKAQVIG